MSKASWRAPMIALLLIGLVGAFATRPAAAQPAGPDGALLRLADLPPGWSVAEDDEDLTEGITEESLCEDGRFLAPVEAGAVLFERALEEPASSSFPELSAGYAILIHGVLRFAPGAAAPAFACLRTAVEESLIDLGDVLNSEATITRLALDGLGEERYGIRVFERERERTESPFPAATAITDYVIVRRGETISLIAYMEVDLYASSREATPVDLTVQLARLVDQRLATTLKGR